MNKYVKGFLIGLVACAIIFVLVVLIMGSVHGLNFVEEIKSWFASGKVDIPPVEDVVDQVSAMIKI